MLEYFASEAQTPEIKFLDSRTKKFFFLRPNLLGPNISAILRKKSKNATNSGLRVGCFNCTISSSKNEVLFVHLPIRKGVFSQLRKFQF